MRTAKNPSRVARRRGASAVELAMILPVLVTIVLGCVDFGRFAYNYIAVTNAARAGASYAIMNNYRTLTEEATWRASVRQAARDEMEQQTGYSAASLIVPNPVVSRDPMTNLRRVQVTATYPFSTIVNWNWPGLRIPNRFNMSRVVEMRVIR